MMNPQIDVSRKNSRIHQKKEEFDIAFRSQNSSGWQFPLSVLDNLWAGDYFEGAVAIMTGIPEWLRTSGMTGESGFCPDK
jgi:hypothetical protein